MEIIGPVLKPPMPASCLRFPIAEQTKSLNEPGKSNTAVNMTSAINSTNSSQSSPSQLNNTNLSSLPNTPAGESKQIDQSEDKRPSSADMHVIENDVQSTSSNYLNGACDNVIRKNDFLPDNIQDWGQLLEQFTSFYQTKVKQMNSEDMCVPTSSSLSTSIVDTNQTKPMDSSSFQTLLANMSQYFPNPNLTTAMSSKPQADPAHVSSVKSNVYNTENPVKSTPEKNDLHLEHGVTHNHVHPTTDNRINPSIGPSLSDEHDPLALTASLLAMMAAQNEAGLSKLPEIPFSFPSTITPNSVCNFSTKSTEISNSSSSLQQNLFSQPYLNEAPYNSGFNMPDGRDFLYQLGERLIALASTTPENLPKPPPNWNHPPPTVGTSDPSAFGYPQPTHPASLNQNPLTDIMKAANLFQLTTRSPITSNSTTLNSFNASSMDRKTSNSTPNAPGFIGISMRGNQKYSAYYQHQRKHGVLSNNIPSSEFGLTSHSSTSGRRQFESPISNGHSGSTAGRRTRTSFPSTIGNPFGSGSRGTHRSGRGHNMNPLLSNLRASTYNKSAYNINSQKVNEGHQTGGITQPTPDRLTNAHRLRDTAFLCSCGRDFENLYVFTIHMKDTGHKPKIDQTERDIPKLVRGQDMWINSETEQTREILRCMRCHQSFRNLPELTLHMMKTNHYSEIVYNDSGRLVFVNPDEQRRGNTNHSTTSNMASTNANTESSKGRTDLFGSNNATSANRRSVRTPSEPSPPHSFLSRLDKPGEVNTPKVSKIDIDNTKVDSIIIPPKRRKIPSGNYTRDLHYPPTDQIRATKSEPPPSPPNVLIEAGETSLSELSINLSSYDVINASNQSESNVLSKLQSFVNADQISRSDNLSSSTSRISSPPSESNHSCHDIASSANKCSSNCSGRKRRHSNSSLPTALESDDEEIRRSGKSSRTTTSPEKVTSSTEPQACLTENPLSSLQRLVETTHKPTPPSAAFSNSMDSNSLFITCPPNSSFTPTKQMRMMNKLSQPSARELHNLTPSKTSSSASTTPISPTDSAFTPLVSPIMEQEGIMPALSALYAYVEKSTHLQSTPPSHQALHVVAPSVSDQSASNHVGESILADTNQSKTDSATTLLQAFCTATMSNLAMQFMNGGNNQLNPQFDVLKQLMSNFESIGNRSVDGQQPPNFGESDWLKMLQLLAGQMKHNSVIDNKNSPDSQMSDEASFKHRLPSVEQHSHVYDHHHTEIDDRFLPTPASLKVQRAANSTSRFQIPRAAEVASQNNNNMLPNMINKKAKCHFCGKPFANKGQVRLHISKNKCPCLLQQSCHVAAMAAAFGNEVRSNTSTTTALKQMNLPRLPTSQQQNYVKHPQSNFPPSTSSSAQQLDGSNEAVTSALTLLKQRFQDFDPNTSMRPPNFPEPASISSMFNKLTDSNQPDHQSTQQMIGTHQWPGMNNDSSSSPVPQADSGAAANASHLAAMALLAQTLVQLTSAHNSRPEQIVEPPSTSSTHPPYTLPSYASSSAVDFLPQGFPLFNPASFNFDMLLNQANLATQLTRLTWSNSTNTIPTNPKPAVSDS